MKLFELFATLGLDTSEFDTGVRSSTKKGKSLGETMGSTISKAGKGITGTLKAVTDGAGKVINVTEGMLKKISIGVGAAGAAFGKIAVDALGGIGRLEQNLGGIETLFGGAYGTVFQNAQKAFETSGMDANAYMETATGFAASLLQSVGGNTMDAANLTDMAITDMSDNANKMGTSMESIQYAYQGFAKQNYTMLDNLKLGYGGTKEEMKRLLADAGKITGKKYDLSNLSDIFEAIHAIQGELGITGTTAKEAAETLEGSGASAKAAWKNFLSGAGTAKQVAATFKTYTKNIVKNVKTMLPNLTQGFTEIVTELAPEIPAILETLFPSIFDGATALLSGLFAALPGILQSLIQSVPKLTGGLQALFEGLLGGAPALVATTSELFKGLMDGFMAMLPSLAALASEIAPTLIAGILTFKGDMLLAGLEILTGIISGLASDPQKVTDAVSDVITKIGTWLATPGNLKSLVNDAIAIVKAIAEGLTTKDAITAISGAISALIGALSGDEKGNEGRANAIAEAIGNIKNFVTDLVTWISENKGIIEGVGITLGLLWAALNPGAFAVLLAVGAVSWIATNWDKVKEAVSNAWDAVSGFFTQTIPDAFRRVIDSVVSLWNGIVGAIQGAIDKIKEFFSYDTGDANYNVTQTLSQNDPYASENTGGVYDPFDSLDGGDDPPKATGLDYVPYDNFRARLHEGEAVLTKSEARDWRKGGDAPDLSAFGEIIAAAVREGIAGMAVNMNGQRVGDMVTDTVSRNIQRAALAGRYGG